MKSRGQPLHPAACSFFEPRFGYDCSSGRVHTDACAVETAKSVNSQKYSLATPSLLPAYQAHLIPG